MRIRTFSGIDFERVSKILGNEWHAKYGSQSYWHGADELCEHLSQTDQGFVAEDDNGTFLGVILLASPNEQDHNQELRMHWLQQRSRIGAMAVALGINARADAAFLNDENALLKKAAEEYGSDGVGQIVLLIVSEDARGQGVGRKLMQRGVAWLQEHGATTTRLVTDDDCDWEFYERLGMEQTLFDLYTDAPTCGLYIYQDATQHLADALA